MIHQIFFSLILILFVTGLGCQSKGNGNNENNITDTIPPPDLSLPGGFSNQQSLFFDSNAVHIFLQRYPKWHTHAQEIHRFYRARKYAFAWYDQQGLIEQAWNLYNKIENIGEEGVSVSLIYASELHKMMDDTAGIEHTRPDVLLDMMLTAQYFFYAKHIWTGLGTKGMQAIRWDLPRKKISYESFLDSLLIAPSSEFLLHEPVYFQYKLLKEELKKYRKIAELGGWNQVTSLKKSLKRGDSSEIIPSVRRRLFKSGDIFEQNENKVFDESLDVAVRQFQHRHGLTEDGIIGKSVVEAMNVSIKKRIEQIIVNMERCRWLPVHLRNDYLIINIPEFRLHAFLNDSALWSMKVVVGKTIHETAIFNGNIKYVVFAPYWNVPESILKNEILPAIAKNKKYIEQNHMEWVGKTLRQKPGEWNALGKVKFLFPNSHNIYLHDTPAKDLFRRDQRNFSHGCIRVEQPKKLAQYLLRENSEWTEKRIDSAMNGTKELYVNLKKNCPVFIAYFTSWVDQVGKINFRNDIYNKDARLINMILDKEPEQNTSY